jgi:hypothetical protein
LDRGDELIYQIRTGEGRSPDDVVTELVQAAWRALVESSSPKVPDPHRWPDLYEDFQAVFKRRLLFYKGCGTLHECRFSSALVDARPADLPPAGPTYILILKGGLLQLVEGLAGLAWRRFRAGFPRSDPRRRELRENFRGVLLRALAPLLYYNESCSTCRIRSTAPERRIWQPTSRL